MGSTYQFQGLGSWTDLGFAFSVGSMFSPPSSALLWGEGSQAEPKLEDLHVLFPSCLQGFPHLTCCSRFLPKPPDDSQLRGPGALAPGE